MSSPLQTEVAERRATRQANVHQRVDPPHPSQFETVKVVKGDDLTESPATVVKSRVRAVAPETVRSLLQDQDPASSHDSNDQPIPEAPSDKRPDGEDQTDWLERQDAAERWATRESAFARRLRQAEQLVAQMRQRQVELDRREAQLNRRVAAIEQQERVTRMWIDEKVMAINDLRNRVFLEATELASQQKELERERQTAQQKMAEWQHSCDRLEREKDAELNAKQSALNEAKQACREEFEKYEAATDRRRRQWERADRARIEAEETRRKFEKEHQLMRQRSTAVLVLRTQLAQMLSKSKSLLAGRLAKLDVLQAAARSRQTQRDRAIDVREREVARRYEQVQQKQFELVSTEIAMRQLWSRIDSKADATQEGRRVQFLKLQLEQQLSGRLTEIRKAQAALSLQESQLAQSTRHMERLRLELSDWFKVQHEQSVAEREQLDQIRKHLQRRATRSQAA